jgi:hypothetical protein
VYYLLGLNMSHAICFHVCSWNFQLFQDREGLRREDWNLLQVMWGSNPSHFPSISFIESNLIEHVLNGPTNNRAQRELGDSPVGKLLWRQLLPTRVESYSKQGCLPLSFLRKLAVPCPWLPCQVISKKKEQSSKRFFRKLEGQRLY